MRRWCFRWDGRYFCVALLLSLVEVLIALYVHDAWIRPIFGDVLIVFVLYCFLCSIAETPYAIVIVTAFSCIVELTQIIPLVDFLHIKQPVIRVLMGTTFDWMDVLAYLGAGCLLWGWEHWQIYIKRVLKKDEC